MTIDFELIRSILFVHVFVNRTKKSETYQSWIFRYLYFETEKKIRKKQYYELHIRELKKN